MKNKHGRVGVKRQRPTRAELKKNMYQHGFTAGKEHERAKTIHISDKHRQEMEFTQSLLKLRSAGAIHEAIRNHVS